MSLDILSEQRAVQLSEQLNQELAKNPETSLAEELLYYYFKFLTDNAAELSEPLFQPQLLKSGDLALASPYNANFQSLISNLTLIYRWLQTLGDNATGNFNYLLSRYNGLKTIGLRLSNLAADLKLLSQDKELSLIYSDTFTSLDKVDIQSTYNFPLVYLDLAGGITTLPIKEIKTPVIAEIKLNADSNGSAGNSLVGSSAEQHTNLTTLIDGDVSTWFEYELVTNDSQTQSLVLDLTLSFQNNMLINNIRLVPNHLDDAGAINVVDLQVSLDGRTFTSLKKEIQLLQPEADIWSLGPTSNRGSGEASYYFMPKNASYLRLILESKSAVLIDGTALGNRRYALALREILPQAITYQAVGELRSVAYAAYDEIKKIALETEQFNLPDTICKLTHYVSVDQGQTWWQLQPRDGNDETLLKILSFNTTDQNAITTDNPVSSLKYRTVLQRQSGSITTDLNLKEYTTAKTELLTFPRSYPYSLTLSQQPVQGSLFIGFPLKGSCGKDRLMLLGYSNGMAEQSFTLPDGIREGEQQIYVGSQLWQQVNNFNQSDSLDRTYIFNPETASVFFGNSVKGMIPTIGQPIYLDLPAERVLANPQSDITFTLRYPTDGDTTKVEIYRVHPTQFINHEPLPRGVKEISLQNQHLILGSVTYSLGTEVTYVNGKTELTQTGQYSIDYFNGKLYLYEVLASDSNATISYSYKEWEQVPANNWRFTNDYQSVQIDSEVFYDYTINDEDLSDQVGHYLIDLDNLCVTPGSITFSNNSELTKELPFIDGISEFLGMAYKSDGTVPAGVTTFVLNPIPLAGYQLAFSTQQALLVQVDDISKVTASGYYYVDFLTGTVTTYLPTIAGTVNYYYRTDLEAFNNCYSVDYRQGQVHLYRSLLADCLISYRYSDYRVAYDIAKIISSDAYELSLSGQTITFTDPRVITDILQSPDSDRVFFAAYRYVDSTIDSKVYEMFTPVLANYALKATTISQL